MRTAILPLVPLLVALACGSSSGPPPESPAHAAPAPAPAPAPSDVVVALCADLSSPELATRAAATRDLLPRLDRAIEGGTEQQMEAVADFCARETGRRPVLGSGDVPPEDAAGCFDTCVEGRVANGETREDAEGECMQDCSEGE